MPPGGQYGPSFTLSVSSKDNYHPYLITSRIFEVHCRLTRFASCDYVTFLDSSFCNMHNISLLRMKLKLFLSLGLISSTSLVGAYWVVSSLTFLCAQLPRPVETAGLLTDTLAVTHSNYHQLRMKYHALTHCPRLLCMAQLLPHLPGAPLPNIPLSSYFLKCPILNDILGLSDGGTCLEVMGMTCG